MVDEVKKVKKVVEVEVVEMTIEVSDKFYEQMKAAKKMVADKRGYDISNGEYIEEAMNDLVQMVEELQNKVIEASQIIQKQDEALGAAEVVDSIVGEEDDVPKTAEGVPEDLYAHIVKDEDKHTMYQ